jgi:hypothetical protein
MKIYKAIGATLLAFASSLSYAQEAKFMFGIEVGNSQIDIDSKVANISNEFDTKGFSASYVAGYRWENNLVLEANMTSSSNSDQMWFGTSDYFDTYELKLMAGYSFAVNESLRITPLLGYSDWELDSNEGIPHFQSNEDAKRYRFNGKDLTYKLRLDIPLGDLFVWSVSYARTNMDIGGLRLLQLGIRMDF